MGLEVYIHTISLTIVTLIAVYVYDWIFIFLDELFSGIIREILENLINDVLKRTPEKKIKFRKFWYYIPNFTIFIVTAILILPRLIKLGINKVNPILENLLKQDTLIFILAILIIIVILYFLFRQFYFKSMKEKAKRRQNLQQKILS